MLLAGVTNAQKVWVVDTTSNAESLLIKTRPFTAVTVRLTKQKNNELPKLKVGQKVIPLIVDEHVDNEIFDQSALIVENGTVIELIGQPNIRYQIIFQDVPELFIDHPGIERRGMCEAPQMILPSVWRDGLAPPKPNPVLTYTRHCIVHHSASGNGNTNYTSLVRNYYVQHTQVNGWDDIGYNFLIAFDGTVFIGRDKQNLIVPQYAVKGAHFCSKNDGTTGICLIGNYNDTTPSDTMLGSLKKITSWVVFEENINSTDSLPHPTPSDSYLDNLAGHRQGCATECPGANVFQLLPKLRMEIEVQRQNCNQAAYVEALNTKKRIDYQISGNYLRINSSMPCNIYDLSGRQLFHVADQEFKEVLLLPGVYVLSINGFKTEKIKVE